MPVNAKAIVDVEVDDKKFKDFQTSFDKFTKQLAKTKADWQAMQKAQNETIVLQNKMLVGLKQQSDALRTMVGHAKTMHAHSEGTLRHWTHVAGRMKEGAFHIIDITRKLASWGGLIGAALTGLSLFGIGNVARNITGGRAGGLGAGMTSGQLKALESAFGGGQYNLDIAGMAQAAATARETSYSPAGVAYSQFGINANQPGNKAIVQLLNRIRRGVRAGEFTPGEAMNLYGAGNAGLSEAGIRSFANLSDDEARKQSHEALDTKKFDIPKDQERAWSEFYRYLSDFGTKIEAIVGRHLTPILKVLEENGEKFLHSLEQFLAGDDFKQFLEKVPGYITRIADTLGGLARMLEKALHMLGFIETADEKKAREAFQQQQGKTLNDLSGQTGWTPLERLMGGKYDPGKGFKETWDMLTGAAGGAWDWYGKTAPPFSRDMGSGVLGSHQGGTDYVKQSGLYNLHQGEVVTSAAEVERLRQESNKYSIEDALRVMTGHESGNQYGIMGPNVKGDRPYGRYQIMGANIPSWTREILGYSMSPEQFLRNPGAQDAVGRAKFASYVAKYGSIADAMSAWASGQPLAKGADTHDVVFKHSTADYVRARLAELSGGHFGGGGGGFRLDVNDNTGGNVNLVASQMGLQPLPAFPL